MTTKFYLFAFAISLMAFSCKPSAELTQEMDATKSQLQQCQDESQRAQARLSELETELSRRGSNVQEVNAENDNLQRRLADTQAALESATREAQAASDNYGVWFRVQIGAYQDPKVDTQLMTNEEGMGLEQGNDMQRIMLGRFRDYEKAKQLQKQVQSLGVKDAWIASYKDGARISVEEALRQN